MTSDAVAAPGKGAAPLSSMASSTAGCGTGADQELGAGLDGRRNVGLGQYRAGADDRVRHLGHDAFDRREGALGAQRDLEDRQPARDQGPRQRHGDGLIVNDDDGDHRGAVEQIADVMARCRHWT